MYILYKYNIIGTRSCSSSLYEHELDPYGPLECHKNWYLLQAGIRILLIKLET